MKYRTTKFFLATLTLISSTLYCYTPKEVNFLNQEFDPKSLLVTFLKKNSVSVGESAACAIFYHTAPNLIKEYKYAKLSNPLITTLSLSFADFFSSDFFYNAYKGKSLTLNYLKRFFVYTLLKNPATTAQQVVYWLGDLTNNDYRSKIKTYDDLIEEKTKELNWLRSIAVTATQSSYVVALANYVTSALITHYFITSSYDDCILNK